MKKLPLTHLPYRRYQIAFKEWLAVQGYSDSAVLYLPLHIREFLHFLEQRQVLELNFLNPALVQDYFAYLRLRSNERRKGGLSPSYLNKHRQAIKKFGQYLLANHQIILPLRIKAVVRSNKIVTVLSTKEVQLLYQTAEKQTYLKWRDIAMLELYYACGLRRSEGINLNLEDLDLRRKWLLIRKSKIHRQRLVPFTSQTAWRLNQYLSQFHQKVSLPNEKATDARGSGQAFLLSIKGQRIGGQSLLLRLKKLQQASPNQNLVQKNIGLHTLRHSIATHLLLKGMKLSYIQQFLGHTSLESTQIYTHLLKELEHES